MAYETVTISAPPKTDLWRQPPDIDNHNAPTFLIHSPIDIHKFRSARVTVKVGPNWDTEYDQGGLILFKFIPGDDHPMPWLKTGIEFFGEPLAMSVATSRSSDSAKVPLEKGHGGQVTIQLERQEKEGKQHDSLWVYIVDKETGRKKEVRQVTCWFANDIPNEKISKEASDNRFILIGVYAARPTVPTGKGRENEALIAILEGLEVKLFDG